MGIADWVCSGGVLQFSWIQVPKMEAFMNLIRETNGYLEDDPC